MRNLFGVFDPNRWGSIPLNWLAICLRPLLIPRRFWTQNSPIIIGVWRLTRFINSEFKVILGPTSAPGSVILLVGIFLFIIFNNGLGLLPYIFTSSRHLSFTLALAVPLWIGHTLLSWSLQPNYALAHLVPVGTPGPLLRFMVLIELLRRLMRPITLSVRLAANIVAGHLLFVLLRRGARFTFVLGIIKAGLIALVALEFAVAVIQAYVFSLLRVLYIQEVQTERLINKLS